MIARLTISADQIRWWAQSGLNGFDTLSHDLAVENAKADLTAILAYLDALDEGAVVTIDISKD